MGVVKANAYGHGAEIISSILIKEGVEALAVATVQEAINLRHGGVEVPILVMAGPLPEQLPHYAEHGLDVAIPSIEAARFVAAFQRSANPQLRAHLKIDTGMSRLGCQPGEAQAALNILLETNVSVQSIWTHLAKSTEPADSFSRQQNDLFQGTLAGIDFDGDQHILSSNALATFAEAATAKPGSWVRLGIALYGIMDQREYDTKVDLKPVMTWSSRLVQIKEVAPGTPVSYGGRWVAPAARLIGTVRVGYADGYVRSYSGKASVGIHGKRYPVAGTVCMDMIMIDLGDPSGRHLFNVGDEVILLGSGGPSADELADWSGTISYEVTSRISSRAERIATR